MADATLARIATDKLTAMYGKFTAVHDISLQFAANQVHALIGPSGCGKSTFLRTLNRLHEISGGGWIAGKVLLDGVNIYSDDVDVVALRRRVGMVFQKPTPFPMLSVRDNVAAGLRVGARHSKAEMDEIVEKALHQAALWDEVNDLHRAAGRSGVGTVMGSKNLKAIAVRGTKGVGNIKNPKAFMAAVKASKKVLAENGVTGQGLPAYGTQVLMNVINEVGALPTRNHRDNQFEGAKDISAEAMATPRKTDGKKHLVTNQACFGCTIACGRISKMDENHFNIVNKPAISGLRPCRGK